MASPSPPPRSWPGLDADFLREVAAVAATPEGRRLREQLESRYLYAEGKPFLLGPPAAVRPEFGVRMVRLAEAWHRAIETIVEASRTDAGLQRVLSVPPEMRADLAADHDPANGRVHICRLDLLLDAAGGFHVLETNANCPGGFVYSGEVNRAWRAYLGCRGVAPPPALAHEEPESMARCVLEAAEQDTGVRPRSLLLIRQAGGNRLELGELAQQVRACGVRSDEVDPREIELGEDGVPTARGCPVTHAYLKLGIREFYGMRSEVEAMVEAIRTRRLFVQNGLRGRWIGDNKLCLAVVSDPAFAGLFPPEDRALFAEHVPWSRNVALLDPAELERVRREREAFVLKRAHDTRGRGVVVGREHEASAWERAVDFGVREGWLVQAFLETTEVEDAFGSGRFNRHDLAIGAIRGEVTAVFMRSSAEMRVNMSRTGRMHPVFLGR